MSAAAEPGRAPKRRASPWRRLALLLASSVVACGLGEAVFRVFEPRVATEPVIYDADGNKQPLGAIIPFLRQDRTDTGADAAPSGGMRPGLRFRMGYQPRTWDYYDQDGCVWVEINNRGFRDLDFDVAPRPGELRVLTIGDSFTFGLGLPLELTWPQKLEQLLRPDHAGPVEVINGGYAGNGFQPTEYAPWLRRDGLRLQPQLVLVGLCLNDMGPVPMLTYPIVPRMPVLGGRSHLLDYLVQTVRQRGERSVDRRQLALLLRPARDWPTWQKARAALRDMQAATHGAGVPMVVVVFPMLSELEKYPLIPLHEIVVEACQQDGIRCLDLGPAFYGMRDEDLWVHPTDQHPNDVATTIIARRVREYLLGERLIHGD